MPPDDIQLGSNLSFLDRLTQESTPSGYWEELRQFKHSMCLDLISLLSTRRGEGEISSNYPESANSVLSYGVTDFTTCNLQIPEEQERVRRSIERTVRLFEPRLTKVIVILEKPDPLQPVLKFQISALFKELQSAEPVVFDVKLQRNSFRLTVAESR